MRTITLYALTLSLVLVGCSKEEPAATSSKASGSATGESPTGGSATGTTATGTTATGGNVAASSEVLAAKAAAGTANGRCPVQVSELVANDAPTRTYKDPATGKEQKIGFCCGKCPKTFDKDPAKYMAVLRADPAKFGYTLP